MFCGIDLFVIPALTIPTSILYFEMVAKCKQLNTDAHSEFIYFAILLVIVVGYLAWPCILVYTTTCCIERFTRQKISWPESQDSGRVKIRQSRVIAQTT